jgi:hypothetical protein
MRLRIARTQLRHQEIDIRAVAAQAREMTDSAFTANRSQLRLSISIISAGTDRIRTRFPLRRSRDLSGAQLET